MALDNPLEFAKGLLYRALAAHDAGYGVGSMSSTLYDTAWVACVSKETAAIEYWVFPSSFRYLLDTQRADGRWFDNPSQTGAILSSLIALYALIQHASRPLQLTHFQHDIGGRVQRTKVALQTDIEAWDVLEAREVGFEVLIPSILDLLEQTDFHLDFPHRAQLYEVRARKLSRIRPEMVYRSRSTLLHSLEAFFGDERFEFDRVRDHKVDGSIMASPAATAAYLMRCSAWDDEAEAYLRLALTNGSGKDCGAVPSAYPSTHFEIIWMASTVLAAGATEQQLGQELVSRLLEFLAKAHSNDIGLVGFAPGLQPDLDDTAKASITFSLLGTHGLSETFVPEFFTDGHFMTYAAERNPSLTANANALHALALEALSGQAHVSEMKQTADYICQTWLEHDRLSGDKWNISPHYSSMLIVYGLSALLRAWSLGKLPGLEREWLQHQPLLVLMKCMVRIVSTQDHDGSWCNPEETAYALLALSELSSLPQADICSSQMTSAFSRGRSYLYAKHGHTNFEDLWVEKVRYHSSNISATYVAAAIFAPSAKSKLGTQVSELCSSESGQSLGLLEGLPMFSKSPKWLLQASWVEAQLMLPRLRVQRNMVFVRQGMTKDHYFDIIPFVWCAANNLHGGAVDHQFMLDMARISFLNYQADEFMEAVVGVQYVHRLKDVRAFIDGHLAGEDSTPPTSWRLGKRKLHEYDESGSSVLPESDAPQAHARTGDTVSNGEAHKINRCNGFAHGDNEDEDFTGTLSPLKKFIEHVMQHPSVQKAHTADRSLLREELRAFLHAHCTQVEESQALTRISEGKEHGVTSLSVPRRSLKTWVRTVSADHTSCPYSFAFAACLGSARCGASVPFYSTMRQRYLASDFCRHMATMCRLYNDYGSLQRDRVEANLNVADFAELREDIAPPVGVGQTGHNESISSPVGDDDLRSRIMWMAEYERRCMDLAKTELDRELDEDAKKMIDVFAAVTDVFGQVYVVKDIASRRSRSI